MNNIRSARLHVLKDTSVLASTAAEWILNIVLAKPGKLAISLSGGSTPKGLYELLASEPFRNRFPFDRVHWFFGDERCVPHDNDQSNYRMVTEALFSKAPIAADHIHGIPTEGLSPDASAAAYEDVLKKYYGRSAIEEGRLFFDITLLGLGADGHTASLFPQTSALKERTRWATTAEKSPGEFRISLTYPLIESSAHTAFLVGGKDKKDVLSRLRREQTDLPAGQLDSEGDVLIFADEAAAGGLSATA